MTVCYVLSEALFALFAPSLLPLSSSVFASSSSPWCSFMLPARAEALRSSPGPPIGRWPSAILWKRVTNRGKKRQKCENQPKRTPGRKR
ncbi:hypothetical protein PICMEDRAFT_101846 [Pichia membranifaciens NRRL Y-2026]|uniref:Secreted protein n=1 Tax=Pichia membranifaciens NRRL Y-2026 TaxID=763406 RepID=A0A1E3NTH2_9ASCO|nr:hypothetical protein PICMEDRAFT_101846 [Pichia membranifaciens NRRL Y-2026]ODQ49445.1 hypothetical protein PICMEDRAFT_101846 [Pichia membranifaciens NRRL Y-2026]